MDKKQLAGQLPEAWMLTNIPRLITSYFSNKPDVSVIEQKVKFGTSGHRGSSYTSSFNEWHILATCQAIVDYRKANNITGPLFIGMDTHALSEPAFVSSLEVLAANEVEVYVDENLAYGPTPIISHAILTYNQGKTSGLADGIVITPSHNPPQDGGYKYNPPTGGPAGSEATSWIQQRANDYLEKELAGVKRISYQQALKASTTHRHNYTQAYVNDLDSVIDFDLIRSSGLKLGVHPLGGAGVHYWGAIQEAYKIDLTIVDDTVDPTFSFMTVDWDGNIRMDPSSPDAMQSLINLKDQFDVAFACDTDHDRHGIVTKSVGLLPSNHYLAVMVDYLFQNRPAWGDNVAIGKTLVSSAIIDRVAAGINRSVFEVPVGFKYFVDGLLDGTLGFVGEESAGASFLRKDGRTWTTDKDGFIAALLSAEITAKLDKDPGERYADLTQKYGDPIYKRIDAPASLAQRTKLGKLSPDDVDAEQIAGDKIEQMLTHAPGDGNAIGGMKVTTQNGWFAARPSGTEDIYKIYAESFLGEEHLEKILTDAQDIVSNIFKQIS